MSFGCAGAIVKVIMQATWEVSESVTRGEWG